MTFDPADPSQRRRPGRPLDRRAPLQRSLLGPTLNRRDVLRGGLLLSLGIGAAPLLVGCNDQTPASEGGGSPYPLARPDDPVTLPIKDSNPAIADGVAPETGGTLKVLNYADYIAPAVVKMINEKYDVELEVTPYNNYDQMLAKIREPGAEYDLVFPSPNVLSKMVYTDLLQPLNATYLPNIKNLWPEYQDPWYDLGSHYTVPYTVYTTGVGYRADRVSDIPDDGYDLIWDEQYNGKVYILDDSGEAIAMSLLRNDIADDVNVTDPTLVNEAVDKLIDLLDLVSVKTSIQGYTLIPEGTATIAQAWSGDMVTAQYYLPKGESVEVLGYWAPQDKSQRVIGNDNMAIPRTAAKPALAHAVINDILDNDISLTNFAYNGYQPPLTELTPEFLISEGLIPSNLESAVVLPEDFDKGMMFYEQDPATEAVWRSAWSEFKAGA